MNLKEILMRRKKQLLEMRQLAVENSKKSDIDNIEIIIKCSNGMYENESCVIKESASALLETGKFSNIEEAIIFFATEIRGLKFKGTEIDENGKIKIILEDISLKSSVNKK